ncbi:MAG TPA: Gfo/Idh/MocA family oxidoreductase [Bacillota bacterium]|nr:Gfo/Idh/MocA family oxidoreductase [Bacillota bacterium]HPJ23619.1 Gfo/Idh/MocA family oxidoreductase [Bacillota bacterium]
MVRFGIVGGGGIAKKFARDIAFVDHAVISAVAARTKEKAEEYGVFYHVKHMFSSYEEMAKSDVIDAVYIATPHSFHFEHAMLFIQHKKHVLVEKPITVNARQFKLLSNAAKTAGVLLMEAMWTHFLPATKFVKDLIDSNSLGKMQESYIDFGYSLITNYPKERRLLSPNLGGGSILDIGVYPISFFLLINQVPIYEMSAEASWTETGVDASCNIEITDEQGAHFHIRSSIDENLPNNAHLIFEKGTIQMIDFSRCKEVYVNSVRYDIPYEGEGFVHEIRSFVEDIEHAKTEDAIMTHEASKKSMRLMDDIREEIGLEYPFE